MKFLQEQLAHDLTEYVNRQKFKHSLNLQAPVTLRFLAQGEYNLNYLLQAGGEKLVLRVNTGSQMNLENQIGYEYHALELLRRSEVTPVPYYLDDQMAEIPYGLLVMEYLPGEPLQYSADLRQAAKTFAKIHSLSFTEGGVSFLVKPEAPFSPICREVSSLLTRYFACKGARPQMKNLLEKLFHVAEEKKHEELYFIEEPWQAVINTEVNSHNFIVNPVRKSCHLIDWEKPIFGEPAQDLSMFMIPTTTMWRGNTLLSPEQEDLFLKTYTRELTSCPYVDSLRERVQSFKFFNTLRAISWCAMAWTEYTQPGRPLINTGTLEKINMYLQTEFIKSCFPEVF